MIVLKSSIKKNKGVKLYERNKKYAHSGRR